MDGGATPNPARAKAAEVAASAAHQPLYASRVKVYPKSVRGTFRRLKWAVLTFCLLVYYLLPWIRWDRGPGQPGQALLIDVNAPRAYFFGLEIWPQEIYLLTGLLILGAIGIFFTSALLGRLWCGYACPQTVWSDLFMLVERWIEGDRGARIRLDRQPLTLGKAARKVAKHAVWLLIALATGGAWILYFNDAPTVVRELFTGEAGTAVYAFVGLFTATTYTLAGWAREQVCTFMCPWPRFQGAMLDEHSLVVTYRDHRGEPRRNPKRVPPGEKAGDCVDCAQCFAACPMGIDIRDGQQPECIGCGLCIDACDDVMRRVGREEGLVAFDTLARLAAVSRGEPPRHRLVRPRTVVYAALLLVVGAGLAAGLLGRARVELHVLRDRAPLFVTLSDGSIRNGYTVKVLNKRREAVDYALALDGLPGAAVLVQGAGEEDGAADDRPATLHAGPDRVETFRVFVSAPRRALASEAVPVAFRLARVGADEAAPEAETDTVFIGPRR
jgi:cytochrome c oxidase accessory protein FixG